MVGLGRLERPTSPLSGVRSNHLSYRPKPIRVTPLNGAPITLSGNEKEKRGRRRPASWGLTGPVYPMTSREERTTVRKRGVSSLKKHP